MEEVKIDEQKLEDLKAKLDTQSQRLEGQIQQSAHSIDIENIMKKQARRRKMNYLERVLNVATQSDMQYTTNGEDEFAQLRENVQMFLINEMREL